MATVNLTINGSPTSVLAGTTILDAAKSIGTRIPTLCFVSDQKIKANCRVCLVEVEGMRTLQPACATMVREGMAVATETPAVVDARRNSLQLILSRHPIDCQSCVRLGNSRQEDLTDELCGYCFYCDCIRDGDCELQSLAKEYAVNAVNYEWSRRRDPVDRSTASIVFDSNKCVLCRRCVDSCGDGQGVHVWSITGRGDESRIGTVMGKQLKDTACVECGQCLRHCPVGAMGEHHEFDDILDAILDRDKTVVVRAEPYFLGEYLRLSKHEPEKYAYENLVAGLHRLGADMVVANGDAEGEFARQARAELARVDAHTGGRPIISASCPAVVSFVEKNFPELTRFVSGVPSPQQLFGSAYKTVDGTDVYTVSLTPCSAKKSEAAKANGKGGIDQVMSPREIHRLFSRTGVDLHHLPAMAAEAGDAGEIAASVVPGKRETVVGEIEANGKKYKAAAVFGLRDVRAMLERMEDNACDFHYLQLLACPEGCISCKSLLIGND